MKNILKLLTILVSITVWASTVSAHTKVLSSHPANGTILTLPPTEITLTFAGEIRLAKVTMQIDHGEEVKLDISEQKTPRSDFSFPIAINDTGVFIIKWRGIGSDGHIRNGEFQFTVSAD